MAKVHFVTGKGGVGKSTLATAIARKLASEKKKTLLLKIDSFSLSQGTYEELYSILDNLWGQKLHLHRVVEEYFAVNLSKIPMPGFIHKMTHKIGEEIASKLLSNKYILKFIEACPGFTPTIFLGKVCWEAREGGPTFLHESLDERVKWDAVVVDAPSTGQALQIFESSHTLSKVLTHGLVYKHIEQTLNFVYGKDFHVHLVTLAEEGPLQESEETIQNFKKLDVKISKIWVNKVSPIAEKEKLSQFKSPDPAISELLAIENERIGDQSTRLRAYEKSHLDVALQKLDESLDPDGLQVNEVLS